MCAVWIVRCQFPNRVRHLYLFLLREYTRLSLSLRRYNMVENTLHLSFETMFNLLKWTNSHKVSLIRLTSSKNKNNLIFAMSTRQDCSWNKEHIIEFAVFCYTLSHSPPQWYCILKGHWDLVMLNYEIVILINRILWF